MSRYALLPEHMTTEHAWETTEIGDGAQLGYALSRAGTRYLLNACDGWTYDDLMAQLEDLDWRAARAARRQEQGWTVERIAKQGFRTRLDLEVVQRLLLLAEAVLKPAGGKKDTSWPARYARLQEVNPQAASAYYLASAGWHVSNAATAMGISERTFKRRLAEAKLSLGEPSASRVYPRRKRRIVA